MKITAREQEILEILRKEPLISQDELAQRLNITRSSAAVHISNLMKKGIILGKGYVINESVSCLVIGESSLIINVHANETDQESQIEIQAGGFAFNMSRLLAGYGLAVKTVSVVGTDEYSHKMLDELERAGVESIHIKRIAGGTISKKIIIHEADAARQYIQSYGLEPLKQLLEEKAWLCTKCKWLMTQPDCLGAVLHVLRKYDLKIAAACLLRPEIDDLPDNLAQVKLMVVGVGFDGYKDETMVNNLIARGVENLVVTDGENGLWIGDGDHRYEISISPGLEFDVRRSLNMLAGGIIYGLASGLPMRQAVRIGLGGINRQAKDIEK